MHYITFTYLSILNRWHVFFFHAPDHPAQAVQQELLCEAPLVQVVYLPQPLFKVAVKVKGVFADRGLANMPVFV